MVKETRKKWMLATAGAYGWFQAEMNLRMLKHADETLTEKQIFRHVCEACDRLLKDYLATATERRNLLMREILELKLKVTQLEEEKRASNDRAGSRAYGATTRRTHALQDRFLAGRRVAAS